MRLISFRIVVGGSANRNGFYSSIGRAHAIVIDPRDVIYL